MALTEQTIVDRLEVLDNGTVQVREAHQILRDGEVISKSFHRRVINIHDVDPDLSFMDEASQAVVLAARTPARLAAATAALAEQPQASE